MRCVLVNEPSYSATCADGKKKTSVLMSAGLTLPLFTSGADCQNVALSVTQLSLTTSHSSLAMPRGSVHRLEVRHHEPGRPYPTPSRARLRRQPLSQIPVGLQRGRMRHVAVNQ